MESVMKVLAMIVVWACPLAFLYLAHHFGMLNSDGWLPYLWSAAS